MAILRPFRGIMYDASRVDVSRVVAPPYDVISDRDRQAYYEQDPHNVVRLIAGEVRPSDSANDNKYLRAAHFFQSWKEEGILQEEKQPVLYLYSHQFVDPLTEEPRTRQGLLGVVRLEPFGEGILPHERTHARAKADRLSLTRAVGANLSPIFSMYEDHAGQLAPVLEAAAQTTPRLSINGRPGEHHLVWSITDAELIDAAASVVRRTRLYIADGHHRYETALNYRNKMLAEHPEAPADAAFNFVLMLLVDVSDPGLVILPTHRAIHDVEGFNQEDLVGRLRDRFPVVQRQDAEALLRAMHEDVEAHRIGLATQSPLWAGPPAHARRAERAMRAFEAFGSGRGRNHFTIDIPRQPSSDPVSSLDVSVLHHQILGDILGLTGGALEDERYISYTRDPEVVLERVSAGTAQAAFLLRSPAVSDVVAVAKAGQVMPQKSTYFYPKPASGIVFNPLDPDIRIPAV